MEYDDRTIGHTNFLVRWIHRQRYQSIINLMEIINPRSFLDYGAGSGSFIVQLLNYKCQPEIIAAYEPGTTFYQEIINKLNRLNLLNRVQLYNNFSEIGARYDVVASMGVLEHLPFKQRLELYRNVKNFLNPGGYFIIQVPVMIGFGMIVRNLAKLSLKKEPIHFSLKELICAGLFFTVIDDDGRFDEKEERTFLRTHRGFDHRKLLPELKAHFQLKKQYCGPFHMPYYLAHSFYGVFQKGE